MKRTLTSDEYWRALRRIQRPENGIPDGRVEWAVIRLFRAAFPEYARSESEVVERFGLDPSRPWS